MITHNTNISYITIYSTGRRKVGTTKSSCSFDTVSPLSLLDISKFCSSRSLQLKQCKSCATANSTTSIPNCCPGHHLLPAPNGIHSKFSTFASRNPASMNLSGLKLSASSHDFGFLPIAHKFMRRRVPRGIS